MSTTQVESKSRSPSPREGGSWLPDIFGLRRSRKAEPKRSPEELRRALRDSVQSRSATLIAPTPDAGVRAASPVVSRRFPFENEPRIPKHGGNDPLTVDGRMGYMWRVQRALRTYGSAVCASGDSPRETHPFDRDGAQRASLGYTGRSNVFHVELDGLKFVVKETLLADEAYEALVDTSPGAGEPLEVFMMKAVDRLVRCKTTAHFPLIAGIKHCESCVVQQPPGVPVFPGDPLSKPGRCFTVHMESFDGDLRAFCETEVLTDEQRANITFQVVQALAAAQTAYGMALMSVRPEHVLIRLVKPGGFWEYRCHGRSFFLPNIGILVGLCDFAKAQFLRPSCATSAYLGTRGITIDDDGRVRAFAVANSFDPLSPTMASRRPESEQTAPVEWFSDVDMAPLIAVDLEDSERFPPRNFADDLLAATSLLRDCRRAKERATPFSDRLALLLGNMSPAHAELPDTILPAYMYSAVHLLAELFGDYYAARPTEGGLIDVYVLE